jgi:NADPH-dependent 2,4-dienoyl-CoA reductase/sulfur reductase-like enzyme
MAGSARFRSANSGGHDPTANIRRPIGEALTRRYAAAGIDLRMGAGVAGIEGSDRAETVWLTDGSLLPADVVILGLGTRPETAWLESSGLELRDGVVCNERLAARGVLDVFAVGDVARWRNPRYGEDTRVEHWTNAVESAGVVATNLAGGHQRHDAVPYVWSDQLDSRLQVFGRIRPQDELRVVHGDLDGSFVAISGGDGALQGAVGLRRRPAADAISETAGLWSELGQGPGTRR